MTDDIVTRLRLRAAHATDDYLSYAAADEIERLRIQRDEARAEIDLKGFRLDDALAEIERLRAICNKAQDFINHDKNCAYLMGRTRNCSCGFDKMWNLLNEADRG